MDAEELKMKRVKATHKMASIAGRMILTGFESPFQLAQNDAEFYGYCFDSDDEYNFNWYPASDVDFEDYSWEPYDPAY